MISIWSAFTLLLLIMVLSISIVAILRGFEGMKKSKEFETTDKKVKFFYWLLSGIHMWVGISICLCYLIVGLLTINNLLRS